MNWRTDLDNLQTAYAALGQRVNALEQNQPPPPPPPPGRSLIEPRHMRFLGGYRIPSFPINSLQTVGSGGGFDLRYVGGQLRVVMHHHVTSQRICELSVPGPMGNASQPISQWPTLQPGSYTAPLFGDTSTRFRQNSFGVLWDEATQSVYVSSRCNYTESVAPPADWITRVQGSDLATATVSRITPTTPDSDWYGCGFAHIPAGQQHLFGGRRWAAAFGGYDRQRNMPLYVGSSMGPSFCAIGDDGTHVDLLNYPIGTQHCRRDPCYRRVVHDWPNNSMRGLLKDRQGPQGYFLHDSAFSPAWIERPDFYGLAYPGVATRWTIDYRAQDVGWGSFVVNDTSWFYSTANTKPGHGRHPSQETWNATLPDGDRAPVLWVYDPADFAAILSGQASPWSLTPRQFEFPQPYGKPRGLRYDATTGLLWVFCSAAWQQSGGNKLPALLCYELAEDAGTNTPLTPPPGFSYDEASGDVVDLATGAVINVPDVQQ